MRRARGQGRRATRPCRRPASRRRSTARPWRRRRVPAEMNCAVVVGRQVPIDADRRGVVRGVPERRDLAQHAAVAGEARLARRATPVRRPCVERDVDRRRRWRLIVAHDATHPRPLRPATSTPTPSATGRRGTGTDQVARRAGRSASRPGGGPAGEAPRRCAGWRSRDSRLRSPSARRSASPPALRSASAMRRAPVPRRGTAPGAVCRARPRRPRSWPRTNRCGSSATIASASRRHDMVTSAHGIPSARSSASRSRAPGPPRHRLRGHGRSRRRAVG